MHLLTHKYFPYVAITLACIAVYGYTLSFGIVHLDDSRYIIENHSFNKNFSNVFRAFQVNINYPSGDSAYYRPLQAVTHIIDAQLGGASPRIYHFTNILLHVVASIALLVFFLKLKYKQEAAFFLTLIFAVHPALVGAIAWVPGRIDTLLACFILASFIYFIKYLETKKPAHYFWHIFFFAGALFTKELAIVVPLLFIFYAYINKEKVFSKDRAAMPIGWVVLIALWYAVSRAAVENVQPLQLGKVALAIVSNLHAAFLYIGKMLLPFNVSVLPILNDSTIIFGIAAIVIVSIALLLSKDRRFRHVMFGTLWMLLFLVPSFYTDDPSSVSIFMEHRTYLPMAGFLMILMEIDAVKKLAVHNKTAVAIAAGIVVLFAALAVNHSMHFKDRLAFWQNAVHASPNLPKAHNGLGTAFFVNGDVKTAETEYKSALALNQDEWFVHGNLGLLYMETGESEKAEDEYRKELMVNPANTGTLVNLGVLFYRHGERYDKAKVAWEKVLEINPNITGAHEFLAIYYYQQEKDIEQSVYHINEVLKRGGKVQEALMEVLKEYQDKK